MIRRVDLALVSLIVTLALSAAVIVSLWRMTTDMSVFMPPAESEAERLLVRQMNEGVASRQLLVAIDGAQTEVLADVSRSLAQRLQNVPGVLAVHNGDDQPFAAAGDYLFPYRYLLGTTDLSRRLSAEGLRAALQQRLRELASPFAAAAKPYLGQDPTAEFRELLQRWRRTMDTLSSPPRRLGVWFSADGQRALMRIEIEPAAFDLAGQSEVVVAIEHEFAAIARGGARLTLSGPAVFAIHTRDSLRGDITRLSIIATVLVATFLFLAFRSLRFVAVVAFPLTVAVVVATAAVLLIFGSIHGITMAFGVTLIGVTVDYPIHSYSGVSPTGGGPQRVWPTLRLGVFTTVIAYGSLLFSGFDGLVQLGAFTVVGLIAAAVATRWWLPRLVPDGLGVTGYLEPLHRAFARGAGFARRWRAAMVMLPVVALGYLLMTDRPVRDDNMMSLSTVDAELLARDGSLRKELGLAGRARFLVATGNDPEQVLRKLEQLAPQLDDMVRDGILSSYVMAATVLPSADKQRQRQAQLPPVAVLRPALEDALRGTPFRQEAFEPFLRAVEQARRQAPLTPGTIGNPTLRSLLAPLLFRDAQGRWLAPVFLSGGGAASVAEALARHSGAGIAYVDIRRQSSRLMAAVMERITVLLLLGAAVIFLVLLAAFRDLRQPLSVVAPCLAAVATSAATVHGFGQSLNLFHLVSLLLVVGLGLDYSLFFNRLARAELTVAATFRSIWICCLTTALVFGVLSFSQAAPLRAIGVTVCLGALLCFLFAAAWRCVESPLANVGGARGG